MRSAIDGLRDGASSSDYEPGASAVDWHTPGEILKDLCELFADARFLMALRNRGFQKCKGTLDISKSKALPYSMIASFKNRALKKYWTKNDASGIRPDWIAKVRIILSRLDAATEPKQMDIPGFGFHALTGDLIGRYAVSVSRNWRITFAFDGEDAIDVDMEDYHGR